MRQQMLCYNNNCITSVGVTAFAYRYFSSVNCPSSVGMGPTSLFSERRLSTRRAEKRNRRQQCSSRCSAVTIIAPKAGVAAFTYREFSFVSFPSSVGMDPFILL